MSDYRTLGWSIWLFPGLLLALLPVSVNLLGDGLDEALTPTAPASADARR